MRLAFFSLLAVALFSAPNGADAELSGQPRIIDGDSLVLAGRRVRLQGIDAPELGQLCETGLTKYDCGNKAREALLQLIGGKSILCEEYGQDRFGRVLAVCFLGDKAGINLNRAMVQAGWAVAYQKYSIQYVDDESRAEGECRGMWEGKFNRPSEWRSSPQLRRTQGLGLR